MKLIFPILFLVYSKCIDSSFPDWLITNIGQKTQFKELPGNVYEFTNGLVSRKFCLQPGFATIDFYSLEKKSSLLRAIQPEAVIKIDGVSVNVGGLSTPTMSRAYLNRTDLMLNAQKDPKTLEFVKYEVGNIIPKYSYKPRRGAPNDIKWPPKGT